MFRSMLAGWLSVEITSADISGLLALIQRYGFRVWDLDVTDALTVLMHINGKDYHLLESLCNKRGDMIRILSRRESVLGLTALKHRPIFIVGVIVMLLFSIWTPGRIFFVRVVGNHSIPSRKIVEAASYHGIHFGASRREVRSEKVKNALLEAVPGLAWVGVNTYGCSAVITVRERTEPIPTDDARLVSSMIALRDGVIQNMTVLRGTGLCSVGQTVKAGQVLISGYTDCGLSILAEEAQGEVYAQTLRSVHAVCPVNYMIRGEEMEQKHKFSLIIGKKRINFSNNSGIPGAVCAKIYKENYVSLPGGFLLPVALCVETWTFYQTEAYQLSTIEPMLKEYAQHYLQSEMIGGKILFAQETIAATDTCLWLDGSYQCYEMIGITRVEENILDYVKNG